MLAVKLTDALDMLFLAQFSSSLLFQILPSYGRLNREPQDVHDLIDVNCDHVVPSSKADFEDEIKLRILRWGAYP